MEISTLKYFEDKTRKDIKEVGHFVMKELSSLTSDNVAETCMELACMHSAVIEGAKIEGWDLKKFYDALMTEYRSDEELAVYKEYICDYLNEIADDDFPLEALVSMFKDCFREECYK